MDPLLRYGRKRYGTLPVSSIPDRPSMRTFDLTALVPASHNVVYAFRINVEVVNRAILIDNYTWHMTQIMCMSESTSNLVLTWISLRII